MNLRTDILIIGAGAAGLMCGIEAGRRRRSVLVIDHADKPAEKIRISGGGRCNFTNIHASPHQFISGNPDFCVSALRRFTAQDFIARVDSRGIAWHEKEKGQLFCDGSSRQIIDMLLDDLKAANGELRLGVEPGQIERTADGFEVATSAGPIHCVSLVIASGGKSIPKMGSSGYAYEVARGFGLEVVEPRPGLVPFTFHQPKLGPFADLAGVSIQDGLASCNGESFGGGILFTHRGLSGPAVLQISSFWAQGDAVTIDLAYGDDAYELLRRERSERPKLQLDNALAHLLPKRLADQVAARTQGGARLADLSDAKLKDVSREVHGWDIHPDATEGWRTAEVTVGGISTKALSSQTMMARTVPGIYFIGECVDVTGWLGGYNFQWAWSSGWAAGQAV